MQPWWMVYYQRMEQRYFFVLGRTPALSAGELYRVIRGHRFTMVPSAAIVATADQLSPQTIAEKLGGTVKVGTIIGQIDRSGLARWLEQLDWGAWARSGKFHFGFSDYTTPPLPRLRVLGLSIKRRLHEAGVTSRFVTSRERQLSSVIVSTNELLRDGVELCFFSNADSILVGRTETVQDWRRFGEKDYGRPAEQARSGMLPPKVARMMIHLAGPRPTDSLLDPFCGAGTILQEALDLGVNQAVGADIEAEAVAKARRNLQWYIGQFAPGRPVPEIIQSDIVKLGSRLLGRRFDCIVSEGYLGPALTPRFSLKRRQQIVSELTGFYQRVIPLLKALLTPRGKMVLALPALTIGSHWQRLDLASTIRAAGLTVEPVVPEEWAASLNHHGPTVIYARPQHQVAREIFILK